MYNLDKTQEIQAKKNIDQRIQFTHKIFTTIQIHTLMSLHTYFPHPIIPITAKQNLPLMVQLLNIHRSMS